MEDSQLYISFIDTNCLPIKNIYQFIELVRFAFDILQYFIDI